ncbi:MAG: heavy metal translocating P-type ATPase metal-binding domain-containing protein, partial [Betaproteobacteria bacterium]
MFDGRMRPMCCIGCEAVANTIIEADLVAFYRERTAMSGTAAAPVSLASEALFGLERVQANFVTSDGNLRTAEIYIGGITCSACVWLAEAALQRVPGINSAAVNQITHRASVSWDAKRADLPALLAALQRVGLSAQPATAAAAIGARRKQRRSALIELGVALLSMMQVMMFTVPLYLSATDDVSPEARQLMGWAAMVLTLPTILFSARSFFRGALRDLRNLTAFNVTMDLPIALAIAAGFGASCAALFNGRGETYFDSISMFVFLLLLARYLEASARESSLTLIERLTNAAPAVAWRIAAFPDDRSGAAVAVADLAVGDVIRIATGEMAAADGVIVDGKSAFDESLLTGESLPVPRNLHDALVGGSLNLDSPVLMRVTRCGAQTVAANLRQMTEQALAARPRLVQLADRVARWIAPLTLLASVSAALIWLAVDPGMSFPVAVAVLAVTCPCALALAAPAAQALATSRLAREGLLITRADTLERIASASDVVFDKTGTITTGQMSINVLLPDSPLDITNVFSIAVALENGASHPIALAIAKTAQLHRVITTHATPPTVENSRVVAGAGVEGYVDGVRYRLGTLPFVATIADVSGAPEAASLFLATDDALLAAFELVDPLKADAAATVATLSSEGLRAHLLSG